MSVAGGIRKLGFRRWYERQLIEGHVYFVTGFLSGVMIMAGLEQLSVRGPPGQFQEMLALTVGGFFLAVWSLRRYHRILDRAEWHGEQSTCPQCKTYGALEVVESGGERADDTGEWLKVRCRRCDHRWHMVGWREDQ